MSNEILLSEALKKKRKRGWVVCDSCGLGMSLSDKDIIDNHIKMECKEFRKMFGIKEGKTWQDYFGSDKAKKLFGDMKKGLSKEKKDD